MKTWHVCAAAVLLYGMNSAAQPVVGPARKVTPQVDGKAQRHARLAATSSGYLVVWEEGLGGSSRIRAARLGQDGISLDPAGLTLTTSPGGQFEPAVAWGQGSYLIAYSDMSGGDLAVTGLLLDENGAPRGAPFPLSTLPAPSREPAVAATTDGFIVAWAQGEPTGHGFYLAARRYDAQGRPLDDTPLRLTEMSPWTAGEDFEHKVQGLADTQNVRIAVHNDLALIVWQGTSRRERGVHVNRVLLSLSTGEVLLPAGDAVPEAATRIWHPDVCVLGERFLLVWTDFRDRGNQGLDDANAGLLSPGGEALFFSLAAGGGARKLVWPAVAGNGLVAFTVPSGNSPGTHHWLVLRQVQADGTSPGDDVEVGEEGAWPDLALGYDGNSLLVYTASNANQDNGMLFSRLVSMP